MDNSFILLRVFCFPFVHKMYYLFLAAGNNVIFRNGSPSSPAMDDDALFEFGNLQVRPKLRGGTSLSSTSTFLGRLGLWLIDNLFILLRVYCFPFVREIYYLSLTAGNNVIFCNGSPSSPAMDDDALFELGNLQVRPKLRGGTSLSK